MLEAAGSSLDRVVKATVFLADRADFAAMNRVFARYFPKDPPARSTVEARLMEVRLLVERDIPSIHA